MAVVQTLIGNIKGPQGAQGATGAQGQQGDAATITVGSVTSAAYGTPASVTNSGTTSAAVLDFVIPQGKPGEKTTKMGELVLDTITTSADEFPSPAVDDTGAVAFGKIRKFFADTLTALASKIDTSKIADNLTTNDASYVLSAKQGKALNDSLSAVSGKITLLGTMEGDVLTIAKSVNEGITYYLNSNAPTNRPSESAKWGAYWFIKSSGFASIMYIDANYFATAYNVHQASSSISWHIL